MIEIKSGNCPRCGGGEEYGNRPKVGHEDGSWSWRCYNPSCTLGYWNPTTGETEDKLPPEEEQALRDEIREWMSGATWVDNPDGSSTMVMGHGLTLEEWREQRQ